MSGRWREFEHRLGGLVAATDRLVASEVVGEAGWRPLSRPVPDGVLRAAAALEHTPAIVWDVDGLLAGARRLLAAFGAHRIELNLAMKAGGTGAVLHRLAGLGLGCDVASMYEYGAASVHGFPEISACGQSFRPEHLPELNAAGVVVDAATASQAATLSRAPDAERLGLRLRVPAPAALLSTSSRGAASRFGVDVRPEVIDPLRTTGAPVVRLRVHTGESTSATLCFRAAFALATAALFDTVETVNFGGGFLRLSRSPAALEKALDALGEVLGREDGGRRYTVEPGGALLLDHAYLVTEVIECEDHPTRGRMVTVDASAWNVAPWAKTAFHPLGSPAGARTSPATVIGPSLYEQDAYAHESGDDRHLFHLPRCRPGDRLVGTSFGAYTMTNGRTFNGFPLPAQYAAEAGGLSRLHGPLAFREHIPPAGWRNHAAVSHAHPGHRGAEPGDRRP